MSLWDFELSVFDVAFVLITLVIGIYYYATNTYSYWEDYGIKYIKPIPFFGNMYDFTMGKKNILICHKEIYDQLGDEPYGGWFMNKSPLLMIKDPELVQSILAKDFSHFYDRGTTTDEKLDPLQANLVNLEGHRWKSLRQKLTPAFSSGKLKLMYQQFHECTDDLTKYLDEKIENKESVEIREAMSKFSTDVIGSCAFGLQFNSLKDPDSEFRRMGREIFLPRFGAKLRVFLRLIHDKLPSILGVKMFRQEDEDFFMNLVKDTMQYREDNNVERNDFIQILMTLKKQDTLENSRPNESDADNLKEKPVILDDTLLVANTFIFFIAGFETTASTLTFCLLELALNQEIQEKLRREIESVHKKHGEITHDATKDLVYMDNVLSETLRKYPIAGSLIRRCTKPYNLPGNKKSLKVGDRVMIPAYAIHHDPKYYPKPEKFDPDRFTEENKNARPNGTYLPFGDGPRICIGARFALIEMKIALSKIVHSYSLTLSEQTELPLVWRPRRFLLSPVQGIYLNLKKLN